MDEMTGLVFSKPHLVINASQTATYECRAHNTHVGGTTTVTHTATIYILGQYSFLILGYIGSTINILGQYYFLILGDIVSAIYILGQYCFVILGCIVSTIYIIGQSYFLILDNRHHHPHNRSVLLRVLY